MTLPPEFAKEFAEFPAELRKLVEAELEAGNAIASIEHGFPAAPCGASIKLVQAVKTERRKSVDGVKFYARNNSRCAGEFTTEPRHFFVLEPPLPPEPEPDMDAIRKAAQGEPDALTRFAQTRTTGVVPGMVAELSSNSAGAPRRALTSVETATSAKRLLHFQDKRPPHEIQFALERTFMTLFAADLKDGHLTLTAQAMVAGARYDLELRFEAALPLVNCYSLRVETSWAKSAATQHDYYRKTAGSWFSFWTRDFMPANPPNADAGSAERYHEICVASLNAEVQLDTVAAVQQAIVAAMKRGAVFTTSHKEGGTNIRWIDGRFMRSDYGEYPASQIFSDETEFLKALRQFYDWETSKNVYPNKVSDFEAWKLILRLLRIPHV